MFHPWDFGIMNARLQEQTMQMTKLTATGSMLKGYTVKPINEVDMQAVIKLAEQMIVQAKSMHDMATGK